eukprot:m.31740 g.31740  ORF g.31740 m.31740 type:complete len:436 (+) comp8344_c0_seq1:85-1392(+)
MDDQSRLAHEQHVTGHGGSSITETFMVAIGPMITGCFFHAVITSRRFWRVREQNSVVFWMYLLEVFVCILPILASQMCTEETSFGNIVWVGAGGLALIFARIFSVEVTKNSTNVKKKVLSSFRGLLMLSTCCAILAVDFKSFPRRFAKTENYGVSLMDLGVGATVFSSGFSAGVPERLAQAPRKKDVFSILALILLGMIRVLTVKAANYTEHSSEYGVHWNFFWTLAGVMTFHILLKSINKVPLTQNSLLPCAVFMAVLHIFVLGQMQMEKVIVEDSPRKTWFDMNREGLTSLSGYISIFEFAASVGLLFFSPDSFRSYDKCILALVMILAMSSLLYSIPSRRLANLSYCALVGCMSCMLIGILWCIELYGPSRKGLFLNYISRAQLPVFLVANVLTGLVNICFDTLSMSHSISIVVVGLYLLVVSSFARIQNEY